MLILLVVGLTNEAYVGRHDCLAAYDRKDWKLIKAVLARYAGIIVTPHILAETSNLARQIRDPMKTDVTLRLARLIEIAEEEQVPGRVLIVREEFGRLGLTDAGILSIDLPDITILTADAGLHISALNAGRKSINFTHLRDQRKDFQI